ncbi:MAG: hypothetical protein J07HX64_00837 [halophilic archaeon J07HX64]|nr:MAG: hypothetical protein J07HX64_00837 [halophilic archaeon J07HX64]
MIDGTPAIDGTPHSAGGADEWHTLTCAMTPASVGVCGYQPPDEPDVYSLAAYSYT